MKNAIIITLVVFSFQVGWTQKIKEITHREINVHFGDSSIKATILLADQKTHLKNTTDYYWYYNNSIKSNQGDYKGRLLDGGYQVITKKGHLITKGNFKKGNKSGVWKKWNNEGKLVSINNWSKGVRNGKYQKYDNGKLTEHGTYMRNKLYGFYYVYENEKLVEKRKYQNGKLHGKQITYKADTIFSKVIYKNGVQVISKDNSNAKEEIQDTNDKDLRENKWWKIWKKNEKKQGSHDEDLDKEKQSKEKKEKKPKSKKRKEKENKSKAGKDD